MTTHVTAAIDDALGNSDWRTPDTATLNIGGLISVTPTLQDRIAIADESDSQTVRQAVLSQVRTLVVPEWQKGGGGTVYTGRSHVRLAGDVALTQDAQRVYLTFPDRVTPSELDAVLLGTLGRIFSVEDIITTVDHHLPRSSMDVSSNASLEGAGTPGDLLGIAPAILTGISDLGTDLATATIKLAGIETGAQVNPTPAEHVAAIDTSLGNTTWQGGGGGGTAIWSPTEVFSGDVAVGTQNIFYDTGANLSDFAVYDWIGVRFNAEAGQVHWFPKATLEARGNTVVGGATNGAVRLVFDTPFGAARAFYYLGKTTDGAILVGVNNNTRDPNPITFWGVDSASGGGGLSEAAVETLIAGHVRTLGPGENFPVADGSLHDAGTVLAQGPLWHYVVQHGAPPADADWTWADLTATYLLQFRGTVDGGNPTVANPQTGDWVYHRTDRRWLRWVGTVFAFSNAPANFDAHYGTEGNAERAGLTTVGLFIYDIGTQEVRVITAYAGEVPDTRTFEWASMTAGGGSLSRSTLYPFLYAQILAGDWITRSPNIAAGTITYGVNMPISGLTDVPSLGSAAQVLAVNAAETAAEWVNQTGGGGLDAFDWATEGNTDRIPTAKMAADAVVGGLQVASNTLIIDFAEGISQTLNLPNALTGGSLTLTGQQLELYVTRHTGGVISLGSVTLPAGGGGGDDAYDWATVGNTDRIPRSKSFGNTVVGITRGGGQLVFELAGGIYLPFDEAYRWATEGNTDRIPEGKMFADTLVGLQVTANTLVADNAQGSTETLNLPNAVTGGALTLVGQQLSLNAYRHTGGAISLGSVTLPAGGGGGDDAFDWATVGNTSTIPDAKIAANIARDTELTAALGELGLTLSGQVLGIVTDGSGADTQTLPGGGSGDDAFDWATVGNSERIPLAKSPGNLLHTVATESYNLLRFTEADGTEHDITINLPAAGSVIESMLAMHNTPANAQVIAWDLNNDRMYWANAATDQRIVDLINDHNPTAVPGAVTQTGGGDRGSGPRFGWEDHTHQIVGIQLDDIPGTPTTTVPDDARLLVELADGTNRKITGANARTSLGGGGGGIDIDGLTVLSGNLANGDDLAVYDDSAGGEPQGLHDCRRGLRVPQARDSSPRPQRPATIADWLYFGDAPQRHAMKRVSGANLKTYIGVDSGQVEENTRVVEHILDRLAAVDERVSDIDQTSVDDTLAFVTTINMKTNASEPTDADRTTGSYSAALTSLTIGPNETGFVLFRIGIDEQPNLYEPQLRDSGNDTIIQNLTSLGFATELSETAGHRYFYLPLHFPVEDTGTLRMRKTTRTAHHNWLGTVAGATRTVLVDETSNRTANYQLITSGGDSVPIPESGDIEITVEVLSGTDRNGAMAHTKIEAAHLRGLPVGKGAGAASGQSDANGRTFPMGANRYFAIGRSTDAIPLLMGGPQNAGDLTGDFAIRVVHIT